MSSDHVNKKVFAVFAVMLMMAAPLYVAIDDEHVEEEDGELATASILLVGFILGIIAVKACQFFEDMLGGSGTSDDYTRSAEASIVAQGLMIGMGFFQTSMEGLDYVWSCTEEHWVRQAELVASSDWEFGSQYDANAILSESKVYLNTGTMVYNSCSQANAQFDYIDERRSLWSKSDTYRDKMELVLALDDNIFASGTKFDLQMGLVARNTAANQQVFIQGGELFCSEPTTIVSEDGVSIHLTRGNEWVDLNNYASFEPGIYTLEAGKTYAGNFSPLISSNAAVLKAGMVAKIGSETKVITYESNSLLYDGLDYYGSIKIGVKAQGQEPELTPITGALVNFSNLLNTIDMTLRKAARAGQAVWEIFDEVGESSAYITTLVVPEVYKNADLNVAQTKLLTILAMEYVYNYYNSHQGELVRGGLQITGASMQLFCRGDITMHNEVLYEDVIFTPVFYENTSLSVGTYTTNKIGFIAIWDQSSSLSSWSGQSSDEYLGLVSLGGYKSDELVTFNIKEMMYDGNMIRSIDLEVNEVRQVEPAPLPDPDPLPPEPHNNMVEHVKVALLIAGAIVALIGAYVRNPIIMVVGGVVVVVGLLFSGAIAGVLDWFGINDWSN